MAYADHFKLADDFIAHLDTALSGVADPFLQSRYVGFVAVSAVTVFELALKEILCSLALRKHKVLGTFAAQYFERINGQIGHDRISGKYLPLFGDRYLKRFIKKLDKLELESLKAEGVSIKGSYANLITWRNEFTHEGRIPAHATYEEVKRAYKFGRQLIICLADSMSR